ncbi:hypothetical protein ACFS07_01980 [Undibacterium arcticum]
MVSTTGAPLPSFTPGSHIDVHLGSGLIRQYSLCNGPDDTDRYLIAVKKRGGFPWGVRRPCMSGSRKVASSPSAHRATIFSLNHPLNIIYCWQVVSV